ncbi:hypothetical protein [Kurthia sp. Dielmo]|uniref:hypothetical protein n=1 Tax=Kurthia sp. Dielmo TaxID=1033738 RepID=UPI0002F2C264|nr:hypothetical protein [Kurthia sp. Dielmo]
MNLTGVNVQQSQMQTTQQAVVVKEGQVLHGTITKLYPDQKVEIQVGNQKMMAQLETPLKAGDAHFFQVTVISPNLSLKVVSGPLTSQSASQQALQLINSMDLPDSKEMQQIVKQFLKNDVPMSREQLIQAEQVLRATTIPTTQALDALSKIVQLKLPMTESSLQAIVQGGAKTGFQAALNNLQQLIQNDATLSTRLKDTLLNSLLRLEKPLAIETGSIMLAKMLDSLISTATNASTKQAMLSMLRQAGVLPQNANMMNFLSGALGKVDANPTQTLQNALQLVQQSPQNVEARIGLQQAVLNHTGLNTASKEAIITALNRVQISPTNTYTAQLNTATTNAMKTADSLTPAQLLTAVVQTKSTNIAPVLTQLTQSVNQDTQLSVATKEAIQTLVQKFNTTPATAQSIQNLAKLVQQELVKDYSDQLQQQPFQQNASQQTKTQLMQLLGVQPKLMDEALEALTYQTTKNVNATAQQLLQNTELQLQQQLNGKAFETILRHTLQNLGLNYEANLNNKETNLEQLQQQLKPQLMALLQDESAHSATRQAAENIISRMNGMHFLSGENGPQHQLIMQVPLELFGRQTDATLQWNGRMKKNGKIDTDYARVMFYLDLASLEETIIDMQVQSRVVTVTVYNEKQNLALFAEPLRESLEKGLQTHDYKLSGVLIKSFERVEKEVKPIFHATTTNGEGGVDLRI